MGFFITFEGIDGSGKTTQMDMLKDHLEWKGMEVVAVREPGGTELGERVRGILLTLQGEEKIDLRAELFLYEAARAQLVANIIKPALVGEGIVLCDRFADSTLSYQGYGRGLDIEAIRFINKCGTMGVVPNLTILIDCPVEVGLKRAWSRIKEKANEAGSNEDRFEREDVEFHKRIRQGYLELAKKEPQRIKVIDGTKEIQAVHKDVCNIMDTIIK